ncbi:MAG TPA: hypothetical protein VGD67_13745 [Pseudonocardiaceae bacterium]
MSDAVLIAVISAFGLVLSGVLVEMVRNRRQTTKVAAEVSPNGGSSLRDAVARIEADVTRVRDTQVGHGERLAAVEARLNERGPGR